jgi:hypothetical protein
MKMTGTIKPPQLYNDTVLTRVSHGEASWETSDAYAAAIPKTVDGMKEQIRISERQIESGRFITADETIAHFYQL